MFRLAVLSIALVWPALGVAAPALSVDATLAGDVVTARVTGATPGTPVVLVRSRAGAGAGPCIPSLSVCLDLLGPVSVIGRERAGAAGQAGFTWAVPASAPDGARLFFQAVVADPAGAQASDVVRRIVGDADLDDVPETRDTCPGVYDPLQLDRDLDGFGDACDCAPRNPDVHPDAVDAPQDGRDQDCDGVPDDDATAFDGWYEGTWFSLESALGGAGIFTLTVTCEGPVAFRLGQGPGTLRPIEDGANAVLCVGSWGGTLIAPMTLTGTYDPVSRTISGAGVFTYGSQFFHGFLAGPEPSATVDTQVDSTDIVGNDVSGSLTAERTGP